MPKYKKIVIAPQIDIESYHDIATEFFPKILDMDYENVLLTDESSIYDFTCVFGENEEESENLTEKNEDRIIEKIKEVYNIDISDIKNGYLVEIFRRIEILR